MTGVLEVFFLFVSIHFSFASTFVQELKKDGIEVSKCDTLSVVTLRGNPEERAFHYGAYLRESKRTEVIEYFSQKVSESVELPALVRPLFQLAYNQWVRIWHSNTPKFLGEELNSFALGLQLDPIVLKRAISLPDTASMLMGIENQMAVPSLGCTSVAAENQAGNFFYGRNLDFAGVNLWDKHPTIIRVFPENSSEKKHLVIGADGLLFGGITGVNEKGITVAIHQNYTSDRSMEGIPMIYLGEMVLRNAENLDEALEILEKHRPSVLWTMVLTDLTLGQAVAVETSQNRFQVRWMQDEFFVQTNHSMHEQNKAIEAITLGTKLNSIQRMKTAFELLLKNNDQMDEKTIAEILSYQRDPEGYFSAYDDILKAHTIQSILFAPQLEDLGKLYLSAERSPTSGGAYFEFDLNSLFSENSPSPKLLELTKISAEKRQRQLAISQAFHLYFDRKDIPQAIEQLKNHPTLASLLFQASAQYQTKNWNEAILLTERALRDNRYLGEPEYIRQSLQWIQLLSFLSSDRLAEAKKLAATVGNENPLNPRFRDLVQRLNMGKRPNPKDFSVAFEFFSGDLGIRPQ